MQLGADSGGTFTDLVGTDGRILKVLSTATDPGEAVRTGVLSLAGTAAAPELLAHGTTVATNALLERSGAVVALVTTVGFRDVIEIGRQDRPSLYDQWHDRPEPLVQRTLRLEIAGRLDSTGAEIEGLPTGWYSQLTSSGMLTDDVEAVAVCLLHADLNPAHERRVADTLREHGWDVTASFEVAPEFREFERTVTTVVNAYLRPVCRSYLEGLADTAESVAVMTSAGGLIDLDSAASTPARLLLSGPAGGVRAAAAVAVACGHTDAISFDMGGTSADVCLIMGGEPEPAAKLDVAGLPIRLPSLDVHTIGAGGGSIATIDPGGALRVGPRSAGADPGPACYGRGGAAPTVTDANLVLGRIPADASFPGLGRLDVEAARSAFASAGVDAAGVVQVVNANMEQALRSISVERGVDPSGLALVAFGGAGPLHACELAASCGIPVVIVPGAAGVLSAVGLLTSPRRRELVRSWPTPGDHSGLAGALSQLADEASTLLKGDPSVGIVTATTSLDCRYAGQSHELQVSSIDEFEEVHLARNGYTPERAAVEVIALRAVAESPAPSTIDQVLAARAPEQHPPVTGPSVLVRDDCTIWVPQGWVGRPGPLGSLVLSRGSS